MKDKSYISFQLFLHREYSKNIVNILQEYAVNVSAYIAKR